MTKNRNLKGLNKVLLSLTGMIVILTTIYWIYYQFITGKVISNSHWHFREFLFWNYIRELSILGVVLCSIIALISVKWGNNKKMILPFIIALIIEIVLINQLQIYQGP
jgi:cytochrome c biogenesis factor